MKFALTGISGLYNYGCEAIVRGTYCILRHAWPRCEVSYISMRPGDDRLSILDLDLSVVASQPTLHPVRRAYNAAMRRLKRPTEAATSPREGLLTGVDCVLSIGGDQFTLWPGEERAKEFYRVDEAHRVLDAGTPYVLWGASVGPFEANAHALLEFSRVLARMTMIGARERITESYLKSLGLGNRVVFMADPAFLMDVVPMPLASPPTIGVNLSPVAAAKVSGSEALSEAVIDQARLVAGLVRKCGVRVALVPHVVCPWNPPDDDLSYLARVRAALPAEIQHDVTLLPAGMGARGTKRLISSLSVLIASRMHCAIAGISIGVPTLLLSYSDKSLGMAEYVYGDRSWVLPVASSPESIIVAANSLLSNAPEVRASLASRMLSIRQDALSSADALKRALQSFTPSTPVVTSPLGRS